MFNPKLKLQNSPANLIELRGVVKHFENGSNTFAALRGIDLHVEPGAFVAIIGKSGSGNRLPLWGCSY